ncbi:MULTISPECIES: exodeoxyribonuclease III [Sphingobacterium]|uniref:exodeoxyribonuclease III n=1 Tax=Sphingobacterium TaxID=28453 RepID=UPI0013DA54B3|nr:MULTISPECIES: endonuclease/exonuclease/phosphatase family protein [unclassified Sphingobacterium]
MTLKYNWKFFLIAVCFLVVTNVSIAQQGKAFKVVSYNIWNGYDFGKDLARRNELRAWVKGQVPDVVALQELCQYTPEKLQSDAESWGHKYSLLLKTTGYPVGITSKYPIALKEKLIPGLHHGALHCTINDIDFVVVHLHPGSIEFRRKEADLLVDKLKTIRAQSKDYIVLGDFNAHSPFDGDLYDPKGYFLERMRAQNKGKGINGNLLNDELDYSVISSFLAFPLIDVVQKFTQGIPQRGSFPTLALAPINQETDQQMFDRLERIDYILTSPDLATKCIGAKVYNGKANGLLSDHYPVVAEFQF